jgi:hypothetical protein
LLTAVGDEDSAGDDSIGEGPFDITDVIFVETSGDCGFYAAMYEASVTDVQRSIAFSGDLTITADNSSCTFTSNGIPNHDFNDQTARFATDTSEQSISVEAPRLPALANSSTALSQQYYDAIMMNGVVLDILSAGCYDPDSPMADADGNVAIGCNSQDGWLLDPLGPVKFGTDAHNAHTQPNGLYHYHGNPVAMFDDNPGANGSPVIGFAADGFPIYGSYFYDGSSVRKATSGYTLKSGQRRSSSEDPGGSYDGTYIDDYEFTNAGDLDECNGMTVDGQYGYFVTDSYPWVMNCYAGALDSSFRK